MIVVAAGTLPLDPIGRAASSTGMRRVRCGGLTVMWDGRRRAARFHGRRLEDADEAGGDGVSRSRQAGSKPGVLFPNGRFKPLAVSISGMPGLLDCAWSRPS